MLIALEMVVVVLVLSFRGCFSRNPSKRNVMGGSLDIL